MTHRVGVFLAFALMLSAVAWAAPPPPCDCDFCVPKPTAKCKLPQGGTTTCGVFLRSGICLGEASAAATAPVTAPAEPGAAPAPADVEPAPAADEAPRLFQDPAGLFGDAAVPTSCCIDQCRKDKDCDAVCGAPGAGDCVRVNSCCRECACSS